MHKLLVGKPLVEFVAAFRAATVDAVSQRVTDPHCQRLSQTTIVGDILITAG